MLYNIEVKEKAVVINGTPYQKGRLLPDRIGDTGRITVRADYDYNSPVINCALYSDIAIDGVPVASLSAWVQFMLDAFFLDSGTSITKAPFIVQGDQYANAGAIFLRTSLSYVLGNGVYFQYGEGTYASIVASPVGNNIIHNSGNQHVFYIDGDQKLFLYRTGSEIKGPLKVTGTLETSAPTVYGSATMQFGKVRTGSDTKKYQELMIDGAIYYTPLLNALP